METPRYVTMALKWQPERKRLFSVRGANSNLDGAGCMAAEVSGVSVSRSMSLQLIDGRRACHG